MRNGTELALMGCVSAFLCAGCFDSGASGGGTSGAGRIHLVPSIDADGHALEKVAPSGASGLESFQVAVSDISLAKDLTTNGSGWSGISGALSLFNQNIGDHNAIDTTMARDSAWASHYIDFCSQASIERIASSKPFTLRDTGDYHWVVINWSPYFKVRASIPMPGGEMIFTHDGPVTRHLYPNSTSNDNAYFITESPQSLLEGPSEDALVRKNNGGTWFRFLRPLHLTEADLDSATTVPDTVGQDSAGHPIINFVPSGKWNVLLVFNPQDLLYAGQDDHSNSSINGDIMTPDSSAYIHVPFLKATAVPYREGEDVMRETYEFSVSIDKAWAKGTFGMRLELYLIGDNVVAATVNSYPTDDTLAPPDVPVIFFAEEKSDGSLSLEAYDHGAVFDGFVRKHTAGEEGTVKWDASTMGQDAQTLTYSLTEIKKMN
jgi:hypothetical protein